MIPIWDHCKNSNRPSLFIERSTSSCHDSANKPCRWVDSIPQRILTQLAQRYIILICLRSSICST